MVTYVAKRLASLAVIVGLISIVAFLLVHMLPGNPCVVILGVSNTPQACADLSRQLGLNTSLLHQYLTWIGNLFHGQLGQSYLTHEQVSSQISLALPIDAELIVVSQLLALAVAVPAALVAALRPNRLFDRIGTTSAFGLLALPAYVSGVLLVAVFAVGLKLVPATGFTHVTAGVADNLKSIALPCIALALGSIAVYFRLLRSDLIATLQEDFVTMARAKGLSTRYILIRHALRPSSFSLLAGAGVSIGSLLTGAFVVEYLFNIGGMGYELVTAISQSDYLVVQGLTLVIAVVYVVANFLVDFLLTLLDPRVRRA